MPSTFEKFELNRQLLNAIDDAEYTTPTPIQDQAIPTIMAGQDVLGIAQTGTGKTAAYLLPILMKTKYAQGKNPRALIFAPTRELVLQIEESLKELAKYTDLRHVAVYGGVGTKLQVEAVQAGIDILVATPGRFMDIYLSGNLILKDIKTMVLDEADKMMDMGFMHQIRKILEIIPTKRQNLLFSATFPDKVEKLSFEFLEFPTRIEVTPQATIAEMVTQRLYEVPNHRTKINLLSHLLSQPEVIRTIVFTRTKDVANNIYKFLERKIIDADKIKVIHSNKDQNTRINAMDAFRGGDVSVLVATDVVARGIDIREVSHVINFDVPIIYEDYVHRIGRTGRANHTGEAITFMTMAEEYHVKKIEKIIRIEIPRWTIPNEVECVETPFEESQDMLREIDDQKKKENPDFKGAFHEKKNRPRPQARVKSKPVSSSTKTAKKNTGYRPKKK